MKPTHSPLHTGPRHTPRKRFGQHFLKDPYVIEQLIQSISPKAKEHFVEIGPGLGALTCELLPMLGSMDAIELDRDIVPKLEIICKSLGSLRIHEADASAFDFSQLPAQLSAQPSNESKPLRIVGNLPYQISTPLLFHLLNFLPLIHDMHFMLQKEVVERLAGKPGTKAYGRLSVMIQYHLEVEPLFVVPPEAFNPPPKVFSQVVRLLPKQPNIVATDYAHFSAIVKQAFNYRRKTLHNSLSGLVTTDQLEALKIDPNTRAEQLTVADFVRMSNAT